MRQTLNAIFAYLTINWYEKLRFLFIAIILSHTIMVFEDYWWEETMAIANYTLFMMVAIEFLLPQKNRYLKFFLKMTASIVITVRLVQMDWIVATPERWQEWVWWLQVHMVQLNPFIWISLALLLVHNLFGLWTTTRIRMFGVVGASLMVLTIADSFTPIWLWDDVAVVVFTGLLWLVANHLSRLQREHPRSWKELIEYPLQLIVPIAIVLSVLMIVGVNMPALAPILQDPYTMWRESKGETVKVFLGDKGTDVQSPSSSGNANSGYSRNDEQLGGGFQFDYSPMMTVSTSHRSYWRGESKAEYTGKGWVEGQAEKDAEITSRIEKDAVFFSLDMPPLAGTTEISQIVTMIRKDVYPVLFAAAPITKVNWIDEEAAPMPTGMIWEPSSGELRLLNWSMKNRKYPETYSVTSSVPILDEAKLRETKAGWSSKEDASRNSYYLQLPESLPDRVKQLAKQVTEDASNDYDRAKLLETYLRLNYNYNNLPDQSKLKDTSTDFVDQFLFELKEGYCDYFSTSMAVMARSLGLPTRWVKGFAPGVLPASNYGPPSEFLDATINPNGSGTYTVRNSDAHSWVEIYFDGFGWIPFEATSGFSFPYTIAEEETAPLPEIDAGETDSSAAEKTATTLNTKLLTWISVSLLVVAAATLAIIRREKLLFAWRKLRHGSYTSNDRIVLETHKLLRICKKRGMERQEHETIREAVLRWSQSQKRLRDDFRVVLDGFEQAKYSPVMATPEDAEHFVVRVKSLIDQLR